MRIKRPDFDRLIEEGLQRPFPARDKEAPPVETIWAGEVPPPEAPVAG